MVVTSDFLSTTSRFGGCAPPRVAASPGSVHTERYEFFGFFNMQYHLCRKETHDQNPDYSECLSLFIRDESPHGGAARDLAKTTMRAERIGREKPGEDDSQMMD